MALPPKYILDQIAGLRGKAHVTYPGSKKTVKKVERVVTCKKSAWELDFYTPDAEYPDCVLISQEKTAEDTHNVDVYRAYQTIPGVLLEGVETDPETNEQIRVTRQIVRADAAVPANSAGIVYEVQPIDDVISILVARDLSSVLSKTYTDYPEISYSFPGLLFLRGSTLTERTQPASYRSAFSRIVRARVDVTYSLEPQENEVIQFQPVTVRSDAGVFSDVLHNLRSAIIGGRRQSVEPSEPTATEYPLGEEILIRAPSTRAQNGLYKNELTYITAL